jgi:hypothetical protein
MTTPFGPQLIGETEKTLNAILRRALGGTGLSEPQWVTLRLADQLPIADDDALAAALAARAHFDDAPQLVGDLSDRRLLARGQLTADGRDLVASVQARIARLTTPIWTDLAGDDVAAAERLLNEIVHRARSVLA